MDKYEARRLSLQRLVDSLGRGGIAEIASRIDKQPSYVSRMLYEPGKAGRKRIGEDTVELLDRAYPGIFDAARTRPTGPSGIPPEPAGALDTALLKRAFALASEAFHQAGRIPSTDLLVEVSTRVYRLLQEGRLRANAAAEVRGLIERAGADEHALQELLNGFR